MKSAKAEAAGTWLSPPACVLNPPSLHQEPPPSFAEADQQWATFSTNAVRGGSSWCCTCKQHLCTLSAYKCLPGYLRYERVCFVSNKDTKRWYRLPKLLHNSPAETKQDCGASSRERVRRLKFGFSKIKKKVTSIIGDVVRGFPSALVASVFNPLNDLKTDLDCGNSHVIHLYRRACVRGLVHRGKRTMTRRGNKRGMSSMHRLVLCQFPFNQQEFTPSKSFFWVGNTTVVITDGRWIALMLWL